jgi:uncharacterized membrane protein YeaQ/YmgE (transglycosylase-associated protein family)
MALVIVGALRWRHRERGFAMGILAWLLFGLIVGVVASWIMPAPGGGGIVADVIVGIVGAFIGGWIFGLFGHTGITGFNIPSMLCALVGAVVLLWLSRAFLGNRSTA